MCLKLNLCFFSVKLAYVNLIIRPAKDPRKEEGKGFLAWILQTVERRGQTRRGRAVPLAWRVQTPPLPEEAQACGCGWSRSLRPEPKDSPLTDGPGTLLAGDCCAQAQRESKGHSPASEGFSV